MTTPARPLTEFRVHTDSELTPTITVIAASPDMARTLVQRHYKSLRIRKIKRVKGGAS
jgi:hypothetical protein